MASQAEKMMVRIGEATRLSSWESAGKLFMMSPLQWCEKYPTVSTGIGSE